MRLTVRVFLMRLQCWKYRHDTIDRQTRLLAELLFILRHYNSVLEIHRLLKDDYKHEDNLYHLASAHEMIALCLHLLDTYSNQNGRDGIQNIEIFLYLYFKAIQWRWHFTAKTFLKDKDEQKYDTMLSIQAHLKIFAYEGLRALLLGLTILSEEEYSNLFTKFEFASNYMKDQEKSYTRL